MNTATILVSMGIGSIGGFFVGRVWAEIARARHDMHRVWEGRKAYRSRR